MTCTIQHILRGLQLNCADPAQPSMTTTVQIPGLDDRDDQDRRLPDDV